MVEKSKEQPLKKEKVEFCINASEFTDITLTKDESDNLIKLIDQGPNEKAKKFSEEALEFYNEMMKKSKDNIQKEWFID